MKPFGPSESRQSIAARLEESVRALPERHRSADTDAILAELDRIDAVKAARATLAVQREAWRRSIIDAHVKIEPAPSGTMCVCASYSAYSYSQAKSHKAKVLLNGKGYCGTHLKRAEAQAVGEVMREHYKEYVPDRALQAIVDADGDLYRQRYDEQYGKMRRL